MATSGQPTYLLDRHRKLLDNNIIDSFSLPIDQLPQDLVVSVFNLQIFQTFMSNQEDDDLRLHKASASLISDLLSLLKIILWTSSGTVHRLARQRDLDRAIGLLEPFQEEPQLVDPQLKNIVPPLVNAFLLHLQNDAAAPRAGTCSITYAICRVLYTLCKVRGEKVIVGFLNHDPPNVERILLAYEASNGNNGVTSTWEERYVLLLWLWHLMLVPFDLQTLSDSPATTGDANTQGDSLILPPGLPNIARRIIPICVRSLSSPTKERDAGARLLVRLCIRNDMRDNYLLSAVVPWVIQELRLESSDPTSLHQKLGHLSVISNLTASAPPDVMSPFLHQLYTVCQAILSGDLNASLALNAVARRILIKIFRNIVLLCIQSPDSTGSLDPSDVLSEVVDSLLMLIGDSDTPVRYAASKVLSAITLKLEPEMATEVIEATLASLQEDLIVDNNGRQSTDAVNALRWHGLTLALAQLLYKRAPSTEQLPAMLNALVLSLEFSQRSASGVAIGTNVRDAACFGIWALSRRYTTQELLAVDYRKHDHSTGNASKHPMTVPMRLATRLLAAACLDPSGNIRRGASAALQELIGRNPNTVSDGIPLVQIVDYQAVGLRRRAMVDVGCRAAKLNGIYFNVMYESLQGERAMFAVDELSRSHAAEAFGLLCKQRGVDLKQNPVQCLVSKFTRMRLSMTVQERHGLFLALAAVLEQCTDTDKPAPDTATESGKKRGGGEDLLLVDAVGLAEIGSLLDLPERDFTSATRNPHLTAAAVCRLISALTSILLRTAPQSLPPNAGELVEHSQRLFNLCLARTEPEILQMLPQCATNILRLSPDWRALVESWLVASAAQTQSFTKDTANIIALGASFHICREREPKLAGNIINTIALRCSPRVAVDARVLAVRALGLAIAGITMDTDNDTDLSSLRIGADAMHIAMNDYTINDRGDVGSLVRLEALTVLTQLSHMGWPWNGIHVFGETVMQDVARSSLEKLDKVRSIARSCVVGLGWSCPTDVQVSSSAWFSYWLEMLQGPDKTYLRRAILEGYCSSAGMGAENVVQASRTALLNFLERLPISAAEDATFTLVDFADILKSILSDNLSNERVLLPLLETLAFLLDMRVLQNIVSSSFKWRSFLVLAQKSHYQSKSVPKILLALDVYRGLAEVPEIRTDVVKKLTDMIRNPMAPVKRATEETLYLVEGKWRNQE